MAIFPLPIKPSQDFRSGGVGFGNDRGKVDHAACDLVAPPDTDILAIADGTIWYGPGAFFTSKAKVQPDPIYLGRSGVCEIGVIQNELKIQTYELALITNLGIFRYGEIAGTMPAGVVEGGKVSEGQPIGKVVQQYGASMLHLEWYREKDRRDGLTQMGNGYYKYLDTSLPAPLVVHDDNPDDSAMDRRGVMWRHREGMTNPPLPIPKADYSKIPPRPGFRFNRRSDLDNPTEFLSGLSMKSN
jgi:murein DD-endopeptidase MepM/ murein hydrolase activator NlpD